MNSVNILFNYYFLLKSIVIHNFLLHLIDDIFFGQNLSILSILCLYDKIKGKVYYTKSKKKKL